MHYSYHHTVVHIVVVSIVVVGDFGVWFELAGYIEKGEGAGVDAEFVSAS